MKQLQTDRIYVEPNADIPTDFGTLVYTRLKSPYWGVLFNTLDELQTPEFAEREDGTEEPIFLLSPLWALRSADETEDGSEYYYRTNLFVAFLDNDFYLTTIDPDGGLIIFNTVDVEDLTQPKTENPDDEWYPIWSSDDDEI